MLNQKTYDNRFSVKSRQQGEHCSPCLQFLLQEYAPCQVSFRQVLSDCPYHPRTQGLFDAVWDGGDWTNPLC